MLQCLAFKKGAFPWVLALLVAAVFACDIVEDTEMETWDRVPIITGGHHRADLIVPTPDGGHLTAGINRGELVLLKVDSAGSEAWSKVYACCKNYGVPRVFYSLKQKADGFRVAFILPDESGVTIRELDTNGMERNERFVPTPFLTSLTTVELTRKGGIVVGGKNGTDAVATSIGPQGEILWEIRFGTAANWKVSSIMETNDGGFIVTAFASPVLRVDKVDPNGSLAWSTSLQSTSEQMHLGGAISLTEMSEGAICLGAVIIHADTPVPAGTQMAVLSKTGDILCRDEYYPLHCLRARETPDGGYILMGNQFVVNGDYDGVLLEKLDHHFRPQWRKQVVPGESDADMYGYDIIATSDGGYLLAGEKGGYWLRKVNNAGNLND